MTAPQRPRPPKRPLTVRAFARWYGVSHTAVQQRARAGAFTAKAVKRIRGRLKILDAAQAAAEWEAHTRPRVDARKAAPGRPPSKLAAATLRERVARAETAEIENAKRRGALVPALDFERKLAPLIVEARTHMLGLPTRARQRLPHLTTADVAVLDALVREGLAVLDELVQAG